MKLKHACVDAGKYGLNVSPDAYRSQGVRLIRTSDLGPGGLTDPADGIYLEGPVEDDFLVQPGDVLVSRSGTIGRSYLVPPQAAGSTFAGFLIRFRPTPQTVARFVSYALQSQIVQNAIQSEAVSSTIQNFNADRYANLELPECTTEQQRRIADFLDDHVSKIDSLIAARREQIRLGEAALDAAWAESAVALESFFGLTPIRRFLVSIVDGPFGSSLASAHYSDAGTRVIRLGNIGLAAFRDEDKAFISDEYGSQLRVHAVLPGDLIMAGLGDDRWPLGRCACAPSEIEPAIVKADCYRIRLDSRIDHSYAACFLSSPPARQRFSLLARGATRARLNTDVARAAELPPAPAEAQRAFVDAVVADQDQVRRMTAELSRSIALLTEYKSSLITAAVSGEIDVSAARRGVDG